MKTSFVHVLYEFEHSALLLSNTTPAWQFVARSQILREIKNLAIPKPPHDHLECPVLESALCSPASMTREYLRCGSRFVSTRRR